MKPSLGLFAMAAGLCVFSWAAAQESQKEQKKEPKYQLYTWHCSRSIKLALSSDSMSEVHAHIEKAKKTETKFRVTTGKAPQWLDVLRTPKTFEVHANRCRAGWRMVAKAATPEEASKLAKQEEATGASATMLVGIYE